MAQNPLSTAEILSGVEVQEAVSTGPHTSVQVVESPRDGVSAGPTPPTEKVAAPLRKPSLPRRLARAARRRAQAVGAALSSLLRRWAIHGGRRAALFYFAGSTAFDREHKAVLVGTSRFSADTRRPGETSALLRRNTHRLEKGLLMRPRRPVFAQEYIEETVAVFARSCARVSPEEFSANPELQWAQDVLASYFAVVDDTKVIAGARAQFEAARSATCSSHRQLVPYRRDLTKTPPVAVDDLLALAHRRRSVRWFLPRPVPREAIDRAVEVAAQSPSACNRQSFVFRVFDDPELVGRLSAIPMGTSGYSHNIPVFVVVVGQLRHYYDERDRHLIYVDGSLATMGFVYALEAQGIATCCINWPDIAWREEALASAIGLEPDERPVLCIAVGYPDPDGMVAYSQKKTLDQLRLFNLK